MSKTLTGIAAHDGVAVGKALIYARPKADAKLVKIEKSEVEKNISLYNLHLTKLQTKMEENIDKVSKEKDSKKAEIFAGHLEMLKDPQLISEVEEEIKINHNSAISAIQIVCERYAAILSSLDDPYMREREIDLRDVMESIIFSIKGLKKLDLSSINEDVILIAHDLTPSDTIDINPKYVKGIINETGGKTSHIVIIAKSLDIPTIVGINNAISNIKNDSVIVIDGTNGEINCNPDKEELEKASRAIKRQQEDKEYLKTLIDFDAVTKDGHKVTLEINIGSVKDAVIGQQLKASGVGLFRSEFLYMEGSDWPSEESQFETYKQVAELYPNNIIIIRTLDIGGDKKLPYYTFPKEENPFLGYRAIRFCLDNPNIFKTQLRALLRASAFGNIAIMLPMVSSVKEVLETKEIIKELKEELRADQIKFNENISLGIMIEIPAAAISSDLFIKHVDFFSIGTNDLIQYTMAADRMEEKVAHLYQPLHPSVLRLIQLTIANSHKGNKLTGVCGSMGGERLCIPLLLGMELDCFSVSSSAFLKAKDLIRKLSLSDCKKLVQKCLQMNTASEIEIEVKDFLNKV